MANFQRVNSISNAHVGRDFEVLALSYFNKHGFEVHKGVSIPIGVKNKKKSHVFDLGNSDTEENKIIIECKSHKWTAGGNVPSAKLTVWNEAMYYFFLAPNEYRKIFFVLRDYSEKRSETLGEYYVRTYNHMIPSDVEIMELDIDTGHVNTLNKD